MISRMLTAEFIISILLVVSMLPRVVKSSCKMGEIFYLLDLVVIVSNIIVSFNATFLVLRQVFTLLVAVLMIVLVFVDLEVFDSDQRAMKTVHLVGLSVLAMIILSNIFIIEYTWLQIIGI